MPLPRHRGGSSYCIGLIELFSPDHTGDYDGQFERLDRFSGIDAKAGCERAQPVLAASESRQGDGRYLLRLRDALLSLPLSDFVKHRITVFFRHSDIENQGVGANAARRI